MFPKSKEEFEQMAREANLIPVYEEYSAALETPLSVFLKLKQEGYAFLLESVDGGTRPGRYSFIGAEPALLFEAKEGKVLIQEAGRRTEVRSSDPLKELEKIFCRYRPVQVPGLSVFSGGAVGYLGYDMIRYWEELPKDGAKDTDYPDCAFMLAHTLVIFDHVLQTMKIVVNVPVGADPGAGYLQGKEKITKIRERIDQSLPQLPVFGADRNPEEKAYRDGCPEKSFMDMVVKAKEYIRSGDIFQVVLSRKISFDLRADPIALYCSLRNINPSPYMFYLSFGEIQLIGSSPEIMVKVEKGRAELRPIAGTRPRGKEEEEDRKLAAELLADEKERAEHLMLVDLGRNDVGRVSEYGSVKMDEFMVIENYSHVMHLVSKVTGKLRKEYSCFDVLRASFPAGTVSGAPKIRAMEIIDELEGEGRGPYAGAVGYIGFSGDMDLCIAIRTVFCRNHRGFIQAGAGIVADSDPATEYRETCLKAQALIHALERAERGEIHVAGHR
ncbi:anthranilate synthase component I [Candidatus Formimonas warabiya]|uniref:anthranilate synthase component I n=1 Tax=Formimonas warabiya TaxID=1761012 RepID=UPI001F01E436|nr:anthranilate synthase component I [Candidatus Formimonas warabiya]